MNPNIYIFGIDGSARLWPMGIGAPMPRAIQLTVGARSRVELDWDADGRLTEVRHALPTQAAPKREIYVWRGDELDRIREHDPALAELYGDEPPSELIWTYENGRPVEVRNVSNDDGSVVTREVWEWSEDGRSVTITESSDHVLARFAVTLDGAGRVLHEERHFTIDNSTRVIDVEWSKDGRIVSARTYDGSAPQHVLQIDFRWDDRRRLIAQTRSDMPDVDVYQYEYDEPVGDAR